MDRIDLKQLLGTNSEDRPSGEDLEYDPLFGEMERAAKGREEQQIGDTVIAAEDPDWSELRARSLAVLERSKDLRAAVQLTRALIRTDGYAGLADGLCLIRGYLEAYWESLFPQPDPDDNNDQTIRLNTLLNLCDPLEFLVPISKLPLVSSGRSGRFSLRDIEIASGTLAHSDSEQRHYSLEQIEAAFRETDPVLLAATQALIHQSIEATSGIGEVIDGKLHASESLNLQPLCKLLQAAENELANRSWSNKPTDLSVDHERGNPDSTSVTSSVKPVSSAINNRDDVIYTLERICRYYALHEPSSPVPLLLQRAKRLVTMGFHEIVQDLAPDGQSHFDFLWRRGDG
ncbi:MAG: type VI secretion system protein TssA [Candidatus Thiodiazotropha sp.]